MRNSDSRVTGILGTVIIHLVAAIFFMLYQIGALQKSITRDFKVEFYQVPEPEEKKKMVELPATTVERVLRGDDEMLNIARNLANKPEEKINPSDVIDKVKEELIKDGKLGKDNYIDEHKKQSESTNNENVPVNKPEDEIKELKPTESQKMEANYKGPTRIYYNLAGRIHTYLPIPIYKCEGSGKIELAIKVNQQGIVEAANITDASTSSDPCLIETAVSTALISRFNSDINSPKIEEGTITYEFVAQ